MRIWVVVLGCEYADVMTIYTSLYFIIQKHPQSLTWNLKMSPGKGDSLWKLSVSGSILVSGGVPLEHVLLRCLKHPTLLTAGG